MRKLKILDCTLRDGGYYNGWDFNIDLVQDYIATMQDLHVDIVEFGFRSPYKKNIFGAHAYTTDEYINFFGDLTGIRIAVMIDAKDFTNNSALPINTFFTEKKKSQVSIVRIAVDSANVEQSKTLIDELKILGYEVHVNLMQIHKFTYDEIRSLVNKIQDYNYDVLYIADSLGSIAPSELIEIINIVKSKISKPLGFHAHENRGFALINALTAIEQGVTYIDATILGMGRGAGNLQLESLIMEVESSLAHNVDYIKLMKLIDKYFLALRKQYNWGENFLYHFSGIKKIHPMYAQQLIDDKQYDNCEKLYSLKCISNENNYKFSQELISKKNIYFSNEQVGQGSMCAIAKLQEAPSILVIANGELLDKYHVLISEFIRKRKPYVISININNAINSDFVDAVICGNIGRIINDWVHFNDCSNLIIPYSNLNNELKKRINVNRGIIDYGIAISKGDFSWDDSHCIVPEELSIAYALACASTSRNAKIIYCAGLDGTCQEDFKETEFALELYKKQDGAKKLLSLTPTNYTIDVVPEIFGVVCE